MKRSQLVGIGAMVLIAIALVIRALFFLHPQPGDGGTQIRVRFQSVDKLSAGSKVTFAGKPVGTIDKIIIIQDALTERPVGNDEIYPYELILSLDSSVTVYPTDIITAKTSGLMGERFVAIIPKPLPKGYKMVPATLDDVLFAYEPASVEDTFKDISSISKKAEGTFDSILTLINQNHEALSQTALSLQTATQQLNTVLAKVNQSNIIAEMTTAATEAKTLLKGINDGRGTVGQLITSNELYDETVLCLKKTNFLIESMGSYGLFFHTNGDWQRNLHLMEKELKKRPLKSQSTQKVTFEEPEKKLLQQMKEILDKRSLSKEEPLNGDDLQNLKDDVNTLLQQIEKREVKTEK